MNTHIVPTQSTDLIPITEHEGRMAVNGRDLHDFLDVSTPYTKWMERMIEYGFTEGLDFLTFLSESSGGRPSTNHAVSLDMAKELSMIQRTDKGKQARQYFIEVEKRARAAVVPQLSPDEIVAQALQITANRVKELESKIEADIPKVTYVERFVADNDYLLFRTVASDLNVGEMELRWALVYAGWLYHDSQRRRTSKGDMVTEHQWSEYAAKKAFFHRSLNHHAPLFKGNTAYTLKVTTAGASAIARFVERQVTEHGSLSSALPALEARFNERKKAS